MKNIWIMTTFTLREALARKVLIFFFGMSAAGLFLMGLIFSLIDSEKILQSINPSGDVMVLSSLVTMLELNIVSPIASLGLLLAIFSASSFVPIMLEKGNIDLFLSKPVSRPQLILGKYFGGLLFVLFNIAFLIIGVWLIISLKFSYWDASFLWTILTITFTFAVLYSLIVLFGVITRGSLLGMMTSYFIFLILSPLLYSFKEQLHVYVENDSIKKILEGIYYIIPKTHELMVKMNFDIAEGKGIEDFQPIISSFLFLILMIWFSILLFKKKDF